ncbi:DMT family transporter [Zhihengliuella halotolerans]|uniref:Magnesium transporter NIPA n=1 Tax=Zhihengliuella halotolerans TaxID=370736 RepID=A0A4Q8AEG0_9MICC|nr:DMT family transporter [Zhihengliuella halotolerans]RZU61959.1 magnesium transporter NIPA [Zhihengliuella halotolerans]
MVWLAVCCAVIAAFFLAFGAQRQGVAVRSTTGGLNLGYRGILRLLANPRWVLGLALMGVGIVLNVYALASAPLTVVQPIGAIALVITTVVHAREVGIRLNRPTFLAIIACVGGSIGFVLLAIQVTDPHPTISAREELITVLLLAVAVAVFGSIAVALRHRPNAFFYIMGAGVLFGFVAVLVRTLAIGLIQSQGRFFANVSWLVVVAVVVACLLGSYFVQNAYSCGPPDLVIAGLTVIDPMVGIAIGIAVLRELRPDVPAVVAMSMAGFAAIAIVGVIALSRHHPDAHHRRAEIPNPKES